MNRRKFIKCLGHGAAVTALSSLYTPLGAKNTIQSLLRSAAENDRVMVLIYLQGGNDGLNTVIPLDKLSELSKVRSDVLLPENSLLTLPGTEVGLHPSLTGLKNLYEQDKLKIIQNVGYPEQNYSHFRSTDIWMSGSSSDELVTSGWLGRQINEAYPSYPDNFPNDDSPDPLAIEIGNSNSLLFQGPTASMSMSIKNENDFYELIGTSSTPAADTPVGEKIDFINLIARQSQQYGSVIKDAADKVSTQVEYPSDNSLAAKLKIVSRLIAGGLKTPLYMVRLGGFDTHDNQVNASDHTTGEHADLLKIVDESISTFMEDLDFLDIQDRVVGMTFSEFGRRIIANASMGTDHGSAAPMFIFGNEVNGGLLGSNPDIQGTETYENNLDMEFDFRQVYSSIMEQWLGNDSSEASQVLFNSFETMAVIKGVTPVIPPLDSKKIIQLSPNPIQDMGVISINSTGGNFSLYCVDKTGRTVHYITEGVLNVGDNQIPWNSNNIQPGHYFLQLKTNGKIYSCGFQKI